MEIFGEYGYLHLTGERSIRGRDRILYTSKNDVTVGETEDDGLDVGVFQKVIEYIGVLEIQSRLQERVRGYGGCKKAYSARNWSAHERRASRSSVDLF